MQKMKTNKNDVLKELAQLNRDELFERLNTSFTGLNAEQAEERLDEYGPNVVASQQPVPWYIILLHAFKNPFVFVLAFLAVVSALTGDM